jgi:hypothetical protein
MSFIPDNIYSWLIRECLESGDPQAFFDEMELQVRLISEEIEDSSDYEEYWEAHGKHFGMWTPYGESETADD